MHCRIFSCHNPSLRGLLVLAALCTAVPAAGADIGLEMAQGPGDYRQNTLNLDINVSKKMNMGLGYSQSFTAGAGETARTYSASLGRTLNDHFGIRGSLSSSPEANGERSAGWGASGSYSGGGDNFNWDLSLALNQTVSSEYWESQTTVQHLNGRRPRTTTTTSSGWQSLSQHSLTPSFSLDAFDIMSVECGYGMYFYDRNVNEFSDTLANLAGPASSARGNLNVSSSIDIGNLPSLVSGFPDHIFSAGAALRLWSRLKIGCSWSRTAYAVDKPSVDSSTFSAAYPFFSKLTVKLGYSVLSTEERSLSLAAQWLW